MSTENESAKSYGELLRSDQWMVKRKEILKRDGYRCRNCGSSFGLEVHHRQYHILKQTNDFRKPWAYEAGNLITLCTLCHQVGHAKYKVPVFNV